MLQYIYCDNSILSRCLNALFFFFYSHSYGEVNRYNECKSVVTDALNLDYNGVQLIAFRQEVIILRNSTAKLQKNKSDYFWKLITFQNLT